MILNCNNSIVKGCNFTENDLTVFANGTNLTISVVTL
ncbi:hypothetical protein ALNOE001_20700 [Candidatus Methanobinarius endosymbioticus]|uniref:Uncharacterized protein n=1 Tax=Candidatus Methanobinarius endosymbioticus TaxID=2006182 RepID=A0A366MA04_9EURY|nr:hypothetical protein ALNOE001_20700 [Candidatus Methanobinarius endosymbioticus]